MKTAAELSDDVIRRGATVHLAQIAAVRQALDRVEKCAAYTAETGKLHRDDGLAHRKLERAVDGLLA